jgi:hypothetical protein
MFSFESVFDDDGLQMADTASIVGTTELPKRLYSRSNPHITFR